MLAMLMDQLKSFAERLIKAANDIGIKNPPELSALMKRKKHPMSAGTIANHWYEKSEPLASAIANYKDGDPY